MINGVNGDHKICYYMKGQTVCSETHPYSSVILEIYHDLSPDFLSLIYNVHRVFFLVFFFLSLSYFFFCPIYWVWTMQLLVLGFKLILSSLFFFFIYIFSSSYFSANIWITFDNNLCISLCGIFGLSLGLCLVIICFFFFCCVDGWIVPGFLSQFLGFCCNFPIDEERKKREDSGGNCWGRGERETKMGEGSV